MSHDPAGAGGESPVRLEVLEDGALWRVCLATPKANVLDTAKVDKLTAIFERAAAETRLKAVLIDADGPHFSFGASVEEHLPGQFERLIPGFHALLHRMLDTSVMTLAAVRGQCLGGGLELASSCNRIFAAPGAMLGQPEIKLGVFAPAGSVLLAERVGRGAAEDLCLSGRSIPASEAQRIGLVDEIAEDPTAAARTWVAEHLLPRSASSLRLAVRAVRVGFARRFRADLQRVEELYMNDLMATHDAEEGLRAFLEKRRPEWRDA